MELGNFLDELGLQLDAVLEGRVPPPCTRCEKRAPGRLVYAGEAPMPPLCLRCSELLMVGVLRSNPRRAASVKFEPWYRMRPEWGWVGEFVQELHALPEVERRPRRPIAGRVDVARRAQQRGLAAVLPAWPPAPPRCHEERWWLQKLRRGFRPPDRV